MKSKYLPWRPCISNEQPPPPPPLPDFICTKWLNLKVNCVMMVKYDSTMSWQACRVTSFRTCQVGVGRPYGTLHWASVAAAPIISMCVTHGVTPSGWDALPDCRYVWNPSSFTGTSSANVNMVCCSVRLPLRPEPRSLSSIKLLKMPNQVVSTVWSKVPISRSDMTAW